jgi:hypothetical protein
VVQIVDYELHQVKDLKHAIFLRQLIGHGGDGVGDPEFVKHMSISTLVKAFPRVLGKDGVRNKSANTGRTRLFEDLARFVQCPARLHEVVDDDNVPVGRITILDDDGAIVIFTTTFGTHDNLHVHVSKEGVKALGRAIIRKGNTVNGRITQSAFEERDCRLETSDSVSWIEGS